MSELLDFITASRRNVAALTHPDNLREAAEKVGAIATERGITNLVAASSTAERIVGAAMLMLSSDQRDHLARTGAVLVVDVNLASGTALAQAARRLREQGAAQVDGVVLHALTGTIGHQECGLDSLHVLNQPAASPLSYSLGR
jgi:phosphoribosylpyrophosphate synthetase